MRLVHSSIIGMILAFMIFGLNLSSRVAENRSILIYMILFGHGLPVTLNKFI